MTSFGPRLAFFSGEGHSYARACIALIGVSLDTAVAAFSAHCHRFQGDFDVPNTGVEIGPYGCVDYYKVGWLFQFMSFSFVDETAQDVSQRLARGTFITYHCMESVVIISVVLILFMRTMCVLSPPRCHFGPMSLRFHARTSCAARTCSNVNAGLDGNRLVCVPAFPTTASNCEGMKRTTRKSGLCLPTAG